MGLRGTLPALRRALPEAEVVIPDAELSAIFGNDLATLPNYPAEIRAPAGTVAGVSSFQVHISDSDIVTPGDSPNVLVAMNPAALRANDADLAPGSTIIVNSDAFDERDLDKAGYAGPLWANGPEARQNQPVRRGRLGYAEPDEPEVHR